MMNKKKNLKFTLELDEEKLEQCKHFTALEKLTWLEQINTFLQKALTPKQKKIWQKIRQGQF